ncbi:hypothetical protein F4803DRAFT_520683 [Xylaria telfairii]|nr:hypothetical protein F4803DRAFT_520683 [Xylaria telfairii]
MCFHCLFWSCSSSCSNAIWAVQHVADANTVLAFRSGLSKIDRCVVTLLMGSRESAAATVKAAQPVSGACCRYLSMLHLPIANILST